MKECNTLDDVKVTELYLKPLGNHPVDKYLFIEVDDRNIFCAKQPINKEYFEQITGERIPIRNVIGWLEEVSDTDLIEYKRIAWDGINR